MTVATPTLAGASVRPARIGGWDATWLLWIAIIAVLLFLVVSPFVHLVITSFTAERTGGFTVSNYAVAWGRSRYVEALFNSLKLGAVSAALAGLFAIPLAWGVSRTNMPGRGFVRMLVLATFITPPYTGAVAWILLAGPNAGWLNRFYVLVTGAEAGPFNIYSFTGLAVVIALYSFPYIFIFTSAALELVSSEMEDAANILGAGTWRTMRRVTLPLALPAILGGLIICFLEAIALFASPAMIAIPARFNVVTTQLFQFFGNPVRVEVAAAYAMPLLGVTVMLILVQRLMTRRKGFVALTGKGGERRPIQLGRWRWAMFGYAMAIATLSVFLPYLFLLQAAFAKAWGRGFSLDNISLKNFRFVLFEHATAAQSVINTFLFGGAAATVAVIITLGVAYIVTRRLIPFARSPGLPLRRAVRDPRRGAGDRLLCRLCAAAARALRHGVDPDPGLHHALPADRLCQRQRRAAQPQPRDGGGGAHPGGQSPHGAAPRRGPAAQAQPAGRLAADLHPGHARTVLGDLPVRPKHQGRVGDDLRHERGGELRVSRGAGADPPGADPAAAVDRAARARTRLHAEAQRNMSKLVLRDITKSFGAFEAVKDFSLELQQGEFVSLLGPSGCGKTTTLRMLAGFMPPTSGTIELDGQTISIASGVVPPEKRRMSMIFQSYAIWPNMTVGENVGFGLQVRRLGNAEIDRRVDKILDVVQMRGLKGRYPAELSGGQQQRVALARAIVVEPEVLLLDEPLSNLDANLREEMRFEIRRLHDEFRITTVYVTHDQSEAMVTSDRIVVMNKGRIEQVDAPHVLYARPRSRFVAGFIGRTNFLEGARQGNEVRFDGFSAAAATLEGASQSGALLYSLRPQAIALAGSKPNGGKLGVEAEIAGRSYLGEYWDYQARPLGGTKALRVSTAPSTVFEVGSRVWLEIDPAAMVRVE